MHHQLSAISNYYFLKNNFQIAKRAIPYKRNKFQRYVLSTREAPRDELKPRFVNEKFMSM